MNQPPVRFTYRLLSYLVSGLLATQPLLPAVAASRCRHADANG